MVNSSPTAATPAHTLLPQWDGSHHKTVSQLRVLLRPMTTPTQIQTILTLSIQPRRCTTSRNRTSDLTALVLWIIKIKCAVMKCGLSSNLRFRNLRSGASPPCTTLLLVCSTITQNRYPYDRVPILLGSSRRRAKSSFAYPTVIIDIWTGVFFCCRQTMRIVDMHLLQHIESSLDLKDKVDDHMRPEATFPNERFNPCIQDFLTGAV